MNTKKDEIIFPEGYPTELLHEVIKATSDDCFGGVADMPAPLPEFVSALNRAFWQAEAGKKLMERAYELSAKRLLIANEELRRSRDELEQRVLARTDELLRANRVLENEIAERRKAEEALLLSELGHRSLAEKLRLLASDLSLAEERERRRIASELHDSIIQTLVFSKFRLESVIEPASAAGLDKPLQEIHDLIKKSLGDLRSLIFDISPPVLYELGLEPALESLLSRMQRQHGIVLSFCDDRKAKTLHNELKVLLYHAVRELLVNMVKHASANKGSIAIKREDTAIVITVEDDGIGFTPSAVSCDGDKKKCFGLFNIRERLGHFGGEMRIDSQPGRGTRFILTAPLEKQ